jgi:branched-chain amino acid transport system permease protein
MITQSFVDARRQIADRRRAAQTWWARLPRRMRITGVVLLVGYLYLLPIAPPPFVRTPGVDFAGVLADQVVIYVLVALGLNVVVGMAGLLDLGYVGFYAVGAYTTAVLSSGHASWPWLATLPASIGLSMVAGLILGTPTLRLRGDYLAIVTLGFGEMIRISANNSDYLGGPRGITNIPHPPSVGPLKFGVLDAKPYYWLGLTIILIVIVLLRRLENSRVGRAWTAIREDEDAAELMGVPVFRFKLWAFAIGAAIGGLAGSLYASKIGFINPDNFPFLLSILFIAAVVLGGSGSMAGAIVGAIVISYGPERIRSIVERRYFVVGIGLVLVMVLRPQGLIVPSRRRAAELKHAESDQRGLTTEATALGSEVGGG